jgi:hypothetical protein
MTGIFFCTVERLFAGGVRSKPLPSSTSVQCRRGVYCTGETILLEIGTLKAKRIQSVRNMSGNAANPIAKCRFNGGFCSVMEPNLMFQQ